MFQADGTADQRPSDGCSGPGHLHGWACGWRAAVAEGKAEEAGARGCCEAVRIFLCAKGIHLSFKVRGDVCALPPRSGCIEECTTLGRALHLLCHLTSDLLHSDQKC